MGRHKIKNHINSLIMSKGAGFKIFQKTTHKYVSSPQVQCAAIATSQFWERIPAKGQNDITCILTQITFTSSSLFLKFVKPVLAKHYSVFFVGFFLLPSERLLPAGTVSTSVVC